MKARRIVSSTVLLISASALAVTACVPKRVHWSPDGQKAIIQAKHKDKDVIFLTDAKGKLSEPQEAPFVEQPAWFPDGKRIVAWVPGKADNWTELAAVLHEEQVEKLIAPAADLREEVLAHQGPWEDWQPRVAQQLTDAELKALWMYVRERHGEQLRARMQGAWGSIESISVDFWRLREFRVESDRIHPGAFLAASIDAAGATEISPDGTKIGWVEAHRDSTEGLRLLVMDCAERTGPREMAGFVAAGFTFSEDSWYVVYATAEHPPTSGQGVVLGSIERRKLLDDDGRLVPNVSGRGEPLAGILYFATAKIVRIGGGRMVFSAVSLSVPMSKGDLSGGKVSLFELYPDGRATVAPMLTQEAEKALPAEALSLGVFDVRPDGQAVVIGEGYYLFAGGESGQVLTLDEKAPKLLERLAWRGNEEISAVVPPGHEWGSPQRPELVLYSIGSKQARCISKDWPDELMAQFRDQNPRPATQAE